MTKQAILTIEDDAAIRRGVVDSLRYAGYEVFEAGDGPTGLDVGLRVDLDLVLLDLILPGGDGFDILAKLRQSRPTLPIIILSARGGEDDRVRGLRDGADDYVVKPFSVKELLARVEAVLRRSATRPLDVTEIKLPAGRVDFERREIIGDDGSRSEISQREVELLRYLAANTGRAVSRDELLSNVWRIRPEGISTRTIDMHVARLRERLEPIAAGQAVIETVRGKGYMMARQASEE